MHWVLFAVLALMAVTTAFSPGIKPRTRFATFVVEVGLILLLVLGQPR